MSNVVIEGGGLIDGNATDRSWGGTLDNKPTMVTMHWVHGLTIAGMVLRRPALWTVHPCFCDNVRITDNDILTTHGGQDGIDIDSTWNVYIAGNTISSGDDNIALKR